jgi:hypothetical protein
MNKEDVYLNLCRYDKRHEDYKDLIYAYGGDVPEPRKDCSCDNCFYGRDRLAMEIVRLHTT